MGLEAGEVEYGSYAAGFKCMYSHFAGIDLAKVELEARTCSYVLAQLKQENILSYLHRLQQVIFNLQEPLENPGCLLGSHYSEEQFLRIHLEANDRTHLHHLYLYKLMLSYLFENFSQALESSDQAELYADGVLGTFSIPVLNFYDSLVRLELCQSASDLEREQLLIKAITNQEKMQRWADHAPMNFRHKYVLVEAERARILGHMAEAMPLYEQAIAGAKDNLFLQEEALAYELAARFYLAHQMVLIAQTYMKEAHYCYERWGAKAKVAQLEAKYPQWFTQAQTARAIISSGASSRTTTNRQADNNQSDVALDLAAVMRASHTIASEIELDRLLSSLMQILIETAGAQTGFLILENLGEWAIEAACEPSEGESTCRIRVLQSSPIANCLPESIIQYVIRTHEPVILNNAAHEGNFIHEPYIQHNEPKSLLCLPLLNQTKLVGVLYLENQLATGVFTPDRSQVLYLLSTQAAIAIENAKLYSKLRTSESQMAQFLEAVQVGIGVLDATGRPYYVNQRGIQLLGKGIDPSATPEHIAETYQIYLAGTDQKYPTERMPSVRALSGERTRINDIEIHQNGKIIPVEVWGTPIFDELGNVAYAITAFQDITERRQTEQLLANYSRTLEQQVAERTAALQKSEAALRDQEQELRLITDALPVCIFYTDASQCYQFVNQTCEVWFGRSRDQILGKRNYELLGEEAYQAIAVYIKQALEGQITTYETELSYSSGTKHISAVYIPDFDRNAQVRGYYGLISDISDRKRAEEASILEERNRMAREIHDTLAQSFTGILVQIGAAMQVLADDADATQAHLEIIDELARIGLAEARRSVTALRPHLLEEGNLHSALQRLVTQMRATADTALIYEITGTAYALPAEIENNLFRIGQEALTNAIKYANASEIRIELAYEAAQCSLHIRDDGIGFGVGSIPSIDGFGLLGISERAERIGAQLTIQSQPGQGTEIIIIVNQPGEPS
jgi:PAS domain S-box-containing protein